MPLLPTKEIQLPNRFAGGSPEDYLKALITFASQYEWLVNIQSIYFMEKNYWDLLDPTWRQALLPDATELDDSEKGEEWYLSLLKLATGNYCKETWPASLQHYITDIQDLSLGRAVSGPAGAALNVNTYVGMSSKKMHEVVVLSDLIDEVARERGISHILDLGAGQGYLSRVIAFQHGLHVLGVDMSDIQTRGAEKFDKRARKSLAKQTSATQQGSLSHVTEEITADNAHEILTRYASTDESWLACGLHTCGDLASHILRLFASGSEISCVVSVGCCYHYLTDQGFPLSQAAMATGFRMSTTSNVLACQTPSRWIQQLPESKQLFRLHFYRTLLKRMLNEKGLATEKSPTVLGKFGKKEDFAAYVSAVLNALDLPADAISPEEAKERLMKAKQQQIDKQLMVFWTLRALLAPVFESIILVDRWLYLKSTLGESMGPNTGVWMWPLFDQTISPRNVVIVASK